MHAYDTRVSACCSLYVAMDFHGSKPRPEGGARRCSKLSRVESGWVGQKVFEIARVGSGRVGSGRVGSGRVGSGRVPTGSDMQVFKPHGRFVRVVSPY